MVIRSFVVPYFVMFSIGKSFIAPLRCIQRWAFFKNWLKRSATKRKSSVKSCNATQLAQPNF